MKETSTMYPKPYVPVDMYLGPTFDPEKYLDLERRLFKVEPRPIPTPRKATKKVPQKKTAMTSFIRAATKFACKLDSILRAPFEVLTSKHESSAKEEQEINTNLETPASTPEKENRNMPLNSNDQPFSSSNRSAVDTSRDKNDPAESCSLIKKGLVMNMVRLYEECSDVTSGSSLKTAPTTQVIHERPEDSISGKVGDKRPGIQSHRGRITAPSLHSGKGCDNAELSEAYDGSSLSAMKPNSVNKRKTKSSACVKFHVEIEAAGEKSVVSRGVLTQGCRNRQDGGNALRDRKPQRHKVFEV